MSKRQLIRLINFLDREPWVAEIAIKLFILLCLAVLVLAVSKMSLR